MSSPCFLSSSVAINKRLRCQQKKAFSFSLQRASFQFFKITVIAIQCINQIQQNNGLGSYKQTLGWKKQVKLKTKQRLFVADASIKTSWKCLSYSVAFHFVFIFVLQPPAIASSLLFLPDQAERGCELNMSSHQQVTSNLPPFASMVPINTLLPPRREATDSEGDRREPGVTEIWRAWKTKRGRRRGRDRNRWQRMREKQEGCCSVRILNLPRCWGSLSSSTLALSKDLCLCWALMHTHTHTHTCTRRYSKIFDITAAS